MSRVLHPTPIAVAILLAARVAGACDTVAECATFNPCLTEARCVNGACEYDPRNCNDGDPCTINDRCDPLMGCVRDVRCPSDGLACNGEEACFRLPGGAGAVCVDGSPPDCNDANACTIDSCAEPSGCQHVSRNCNDGNPCTIDACEVATGCTNARIADCCQTSVDCPLDRCHARVCQATVCTGDPLPLPCDDGNPATIDGCDLTTGCTHTLPTSSTLPQPEPTCVANGDCAPHPDPCAFSACEAGGCAARPVAGFDALGCVCRRADPVACAGDKIPRRVEGRRARACRLIAKAAAGGPKAAKFIEKTARLLAEAQRRLVKAKRVNPNCTQALGALLADGEARARSQL